MEQIIRDAYAQAIENTPLQVCNDLLSKPFATWTYEDLEWSESSQRAIMRGGWHMMFAYRLARRHTLEARRLLASEMAPCVKAVVDTAVRIARWAEVGGEL